MEAPFYRLRKTSRWGKIAVCTAVGQPPGRPANGQKSDRWPVDRAVDCPAVQIADLDLTASFWMPIYWSSLGLFYTRFQESFWASFSYSIKCLFLLVLEPILPFKRRVYQEFSKVISCIFHHNFNPCFSHTYLSFSLLYLSYRDLYCERILGDQVFRSPKFTSLF